MMNETEAKDLVCRTGWLLDQPDWVREAVLAGSRLQSHELGRIVFSSGDEPGGMYGVVDGGVGLLVPSGGGDMLLCNVLRRGYWFGYGRRWTATHERPQSRRSRKVICCICH
jgi:CRP/FNR family transcriptional regulator, cyclic AMP receptor protein